MAPDRIAYRDDKCEEILGPNILSRKLRQDRHGKWGEGGVGHHDPNQTLKTRTSMSEIKCEIK